MSEMNEDEVLDVTGESCPIPVVETKKSIDKLEDGEILKVIATDSGSMSDIKGWAKSLDDIELLEQNANDDQYIHYIEKQ